MENLQSELPEGLELSLMTPLQAEEAARLRADNWISTYPAELGTNIAWIKNAADSLLLAPRAIEEFQTMIATAERRRELLVAVCDLESQELIAYLDCRRTKNWTDLHTVQVREDRRSQGIGRVLVRTFDQWTNTQAPHLSQKVEVATDTRAVALYKDFGFEDNGERYDWDNPLSGNGVEISVLWRQQRNSRNLGVNYEI